MTPPAGFVSELYAYDAALRVRWATRTKCWFIERKLPERHRQLEAEKPNPFKSPKGFDLYDGWRDGYVHVLTVHPSMLDQRVFEALADADSWRQGGMAGINQKLDAQDAAWEAEKDKEVAAWNQAAANEAHDRLAWLLGNRVVVHPSEPEPADVIEAHEGFTVRLRTARHREMA